MAGWSDCQGLKWIETAHCVARDITKKPYLRKLVRLWHKVQMDLGVYVGDQARSGGRQLQDIQCGPQV